MTIRAYMAQAAFFFEAPGRRATSMVLNLSYCSLVRIWRVTRSRLLRYGRPSTIFLAVEASMPRLTKSLAVPVLISTAFGELIGLRGVRGISLICAANAAVDNSASTMIPAKLRRNMVLL